jgi:hypothetical protein
MRRWLVREKHAKESNSFLVINETPVRLLYGQIETYYFWHVENISNKIRLSPKLEKILELKEGHAYILLKEVPDDFLAMENEEKS